MGRAGDRGVGHLLREGDRGSTPAAPATSSSSSATMPGSPISCFRRPTRPGRPTTSTAATASTSALPAGRAYKVSYNRPFTTRGTAPEDWVFNAEYPMVRWLEANGYNVSYTTGVDTDRRGAELLEHKVFLSVGHDEYWSARSAQRRSRARRRRPPGVLQRQRGVLEDALGEQHLDGRRRRYRTLVTYKETHANAKIDPTRGRLDRHVARPALQPAGRRRPSGKCADRHDLLRQLRHDRHPRPGGRRQDALLAEHHRRQPRCRARSPTLPHGTLGYEWDEDRDNGFRPAGSDPAVGHDRQRCRLPAGPRLDLRAGHGQPRADALPHASGALVFGAGTVQWSWGLDSNHDRGSAAPSLADAAGDGEPVRRHGRAAADASGRARATQRLRPTRSRRRSTITSPAHGATVAANTTVTIVGHGHRQRRRTGRRRRGLGRRRHDLARATGRGDLDLHVADGSASHGAHSSAARPTTAATSGQPGTAIAVTVGSGTATCPCSIWMPTQAPTGARRKRSERGRARHAFRSDVERLHHGDPLLQEHRRTRAPTSAISGPRTARFSSTVTFSGEIGVRLAGSHAAVAGGNHAPTRPTSCRTTRTSGFYAGDDSYFRHQGVENGPLHALRDGVGGPNGVYRYGAERLPDPDLSRARTTGSTSSS